MFSSDEISCEDEERIIKKIAKIIYDKKMDMPALYMLEIFMPIASISGQMARMFISPILPLYGWENRDKGEMLITVFQKKENVLKLQIEIEKLIEEEKRVKENIGDIKNEKRGWKKYLPF
jgi:hypothetical protein